MTEVLRPRGRGPRWTPEEIEKLCRLYPCFGASALVSEFPGRTREAIATKATELGLVFAGRFWTPEDAAALAKCETLAECEAAFPNRSRDGLRHKWLRVRKAPKAEKPLRQPKPEKPVRVKAAKPVELPKRRPDPDEVRSLFFDHQRRPIGTWEMDQQRARQMPKAHPFEALA